MIKVLFVDDHEMVRIGVSSYLSAQPDIEVVGEADNGKTAIDLALDLKPDIILMDLVMKEMDGIEATRQIIAKWPEAKIIIVTSFLDDEKVYPALEAGATSYMLKTSKASEIADAVRQTYHGQSVLEPEVTGKMMLKMRQKQNTELHEELTGREMEILLLMAEGKWGMTNGTTAARLLSDMILEKENPYQKLFSPTRLFKADPTIKKLITINADVAGHLLKGKLEYVGKDPNDLHHDEGAVVMVNGKRAGAYKDTEGVLHIVDTTCTHLGCECEWNHGERTWDCPCHGSRYSIDGVVLEGPTHKPLKKIDF